MKLDKNWLDLFSSYFTEFQKLTKNKIFELKKTT